MDRSGEEVFEGEKQGTGVNVALWCWHKITSGLLLFCIVVHYLCWIPLSGRLMIRCTSGDYPQLTRVHVFLVPVLRCSVGCTS